MRWTIPNILTVMRLLAAPGVAFAFVIFDRPYADWIAFGLFIVAALTDWVDGKLARAWKQESNFGRMLDPIADKAMVVIALAVIVGLWGMKALLLVPVAFILLREIFVSGPARVPRRQGRQAQGHLPRQVEDHGADGGDPGAAARRASSSTTGGTTRPGSATGSTTGWGGSCRTAG